MPIVLFARPGAWIAAAAPGSAAWSRGLRCLSDGTRRTGGTLHRATGSGTLALAGVTFSHNGISAVIGDPNVAKLYVGGSVYVHGGMTVGMIFRTDHFDFPD